MIAAFLLVTSCTLGSPSNCQVFENERWDGPTPVELQDCADMAERLNTLFDSPQYAQIAKKSGAKSARCELVPMGDEEAKAEHASFKF